MNTRTEHDLLGAREVPADAYWGIHTLRAMENYPISGASVGHFYSDVVRCYAMVKKACAQANAELGRLPKDKLDAIVWACDQIMDHTDD